MATKTSELSDRTILARVILDDLAFSLLEQRAKMSRRTPEDEAAIMVEEALYWERYGQFDKPGDPDQPRPEAQQPKRDAIR